uniref:hypothetical protein n=1 Tax=uncultured Altererythrobacter sp. TaxID=500840 RepID=UPI00261D35CD|nr:hypothetical protein [uncultured Altererythrobacter sp.]
MKKTYKTSSSATRKMPIGKMLTSALPFVAFAIPGTAYAQQAVNTASIAAPSGAIELDPSNNSATDTDTVFASLVAVNDSATVSRSTTAQTGVLNVFTGDTVNTVTATTANADVSLATGETLPSELTFDPSTGAVGVVAGTVAGTYSFDYQLCEEGSTTNCVDATATVTVNPTLVAVDDTTTVQSSTTVQNNVLNVLSDDTVDNAAATTANADVSLAPGETLPSQLTFDTSTGAIGVVAGTGSGTYSFDYQICEEGGTSFCQTATATVVVASITADDDIITGVSGVLADPDVINVLDGDSLNGVVIADPADVIITLATGETLPSELTFNTTTGDVGVLANTPAGTYSFDYQICDAANPTFCAVETVSITVAPSVDLSVTKDNGATTVTSGDTITYSITVSNAGPDAATGAVLTDTPGAGITCPTTNPLAFTGAGAPAGGPFTVDDLVNGGITLGTIGNGQSLTVTYDCTVD